jgi:hypothetical protein
MNKTLLKRIKVKRRHKKIEAEVGAKEVRMVNTLA